MFLGIDMGTSASRRSSSTHETVRSQVEQRRCRSTAHSRSGLSRSRMLGGRRPLRSSMSSRLVHPTLWLASRLWESPARCLASRCSTHAIGRSGPPCYGMTGVPPRNVSISCTGSRISSIASDFGRCRLLGAQISGSVAMNRRRSAHTQDLLTKDYVRLCLSGEADTHLANGSATF